MIYYGLITYVCLIRLLYWRSLLGKRSFLVLTLAPAAMVLCLRSEGVGEDTAMYHMVARYADFKPWSSFYNVYDETIWNISLWGYGSEINNGFLLICKAVMTLFGNEQALIAACGAITCALMGRYFFKECEDVSQAVWYFLCGGLYMFAFNGMRQMLALTFGIQALVHLDRDWRFSQVAWIGLAASIHSSALIFIPLLLMDRLCSQWSRLKYIVVLCAFIPISIPILSSIVALVSTQFASYFATNYWEVSLGGSFIVLAVQVALSVLLYIMNRNANKSKPDALKKRKLLSGASMTFVYAAFNIISLQISAASRAALYPQACSLPMFSTSEKERYSDWHRLALAVLDILLLLMFISYANEPSRTYSFFWQ